MFPVKRAEAMLATFLGFALLPGACGYRAVYSDPEPSARLSVVGASTGVPDAEIVQAVLAGLRSELARNGVLGTGGYPRVVVEVVRVDERASGVVAPGDTPWGRGSRVAVVARAWVEERAGMGPSRDTGDVRRTGDTASATTERGDAIRVREALRGAAEAAGRALARRILGQPAGPEEPL
jgi:hypothetical protein